MSAKLLSPARARLINSASKQASGFVLIRSTRLSIYCPGVFPPLERDSMGHIACDLNNVALFARFFGDWPPAKQWDEGTLNQLESHQSLTFQEIATR